MANILDSLRSALADRYQIDRELGRGGMALVFLAQDLKHHRPVAIKVLRPEVAQALGAERFLREIEIAARLNHPHILPLHDSGQADGMLFYVMPFVEGDSLRDRMTREGQLPLEEALQLSREVGGALSYAHAHGVVHRDIKPENILLSGGVALVADFGIAQAVRSASGDQITSTGISVGTPAYMSPEQAAGLAPLDGRADQYSLACVLYEMLAGVPPFTGPNQQAVLARHAIDPVPPLRTIRSAIPQPVEQAVLRALAKSPADRFATVEAFLQDLTQPAVTRTGRKVAFALAATLAVLAAGYALSMRKGTTTEADGAARSIAVLPFVNIGGDPNSEPFSDGMSEELTTALAKVEALRVAARTSAFSFKGKNVDVREIGRQLHVGYVLEGAVRRAGPRLRVSAQLINAANGYHLWSDEYERDARDVFAVQDEIARAIVVALQVRLTDAASGSLVKHSTGSPEAHDLYLQGRYFYAKRDSVSLRKARDYFERAIEKDSTYALAYAGLSDAYSHASVFGYVAPHDNFPKAKAAALRAVALDSALVEVHTSLGFISLFYDWDWPTAGREFDQALKIDPRYAEAHLFHGWYFVATNRIDDAVAEVQAAVRLDPFSPVNNARLASMLFYARRYDAALAQVRRLQELDPASFLVPGELARALVQLGRCDEALVVKHEPGTPSAVLRGVPGWTYAKCGHQTEALAELTRLHAEVGEGRYVSHYAIAMIQAGLGDRDRAFAELDSAYDERTWSMFVLRVDPVFDDLRADPRFARLVKKVGLTS
jgi:eukaryotic-like serine/threonine-protein kinase